jgi:hypothetical protein
MVVRIHQGQLHLQFPAPVWCPSFGPPALAHALHPDLQFLAQSSQAILLSASPGGQRAQRRRSGDPGAVIRQRGLHPCRSIARATTKYSSITSAHSRARRRLIVTRPLSQSGHRTSLPTSMPQDGQCLDIWSLAFVAALVLGDSGIELAVPTLATPLVATHNVTASPSTCLTDPFS